jgi:hypothetical protein
MISKVLSGVAQAVHLPSYVESLANVIAEVTPPVDPALLVRFHESLFRPKSFSKNIYPRIVNGGQNLIQKLQQK